jgi:hypothetical protein
MYKVIPWTSELDLTEFYAIAEAKGFVNNASQKSMVDCFNNETEKSAWILYKDSKAIGSVAAHSFPEMGINSYRVLARTCVLEGARSNGGLMTRTTAISQHQNLTSQFLLPVCLEWTKGDVYATSNTSKVASQRLVHEYYFPTLEKLGLVKLKCILDYRGHAQSVWQIHTEKFLQDLERYTRW